MNLTIVGSSTFSSTNGLNNRSPSNSFSLELLGAKVSGVALESGRFIALAIESFSDLSLYFSSYLSRFYHKISHFKLQMMLHPLDVALSYFHVHILTLTLPTVDQSVVRYFFYVCRDPLYPKSSADHRIFFVGGTK